MCHFRYIGLVYWRIQVKLSAELCCVGPSPWTRPCSADLRRWPLERTMSMVWNEHRAGNLARISTDHYSSRSYPVALLTNFFAILKKINVNYQWMAWNRPICTRRFFQWSQCDICHFLGFVKNVRLAKDFRRKTYPWLRNFCKITPLAKKSRLKKWPLVSSTSS